MRGKLHISDAEIRRIAKAQQALEKDSIQNFQNRFRQGDWRKVKVKIQMNGSNELKPIEELEPRSIEEHEKDVRKRLEDIFSVE